MEQNQTEIYDRLKNVLVTQFEVEPEIIVWEAELMADLALSMMRYAELTVELERIFGVSFYSGDALNITTVGQMVNFISIHKSY